MNKKLSNLSNLADIATLISFVYGVVVLIKNNKIEFGWGLFFIIAIIYFIVRFSFYMNKKLKDFGTHKIACSPNAYWKYKIRNKNRTLLKNVHQDLYHAVFELKQKIRKTREEKRALSKSTKVNKRDAGDDSKSKSPDESIHLDYKDFNEGITELLFKFRTIFKDAFNLDLYLTLYIATVTDKKETILKFWLFSPSDEESANGIDLRKQEEYIITNNETKSLKAYATGAENTYNQKKNSGFDTNSIFDYLMTTNHSSWMSNDLVKDEKDQIFYTSSENYKENHKYNSFAVFAIVPPSNGGQYRDRVKGVLQFDSIDKKVFSEKECRMLMGLMAHYLNEVLRAIEIPGYDEL